MLKPLRLSIIALLICVVALAVIVVAAPLFGVQYAPQEPYATSTPYPNGTPYATATAYPPGQVATATPHFTAHAYPDDTVTVTVGGLIIPNIQTSNTLTSFLVIDSSGIVMNRTLSTGSASDGWTYMGVNTLPNVTTAPDTIYAYSANPAHALELIDGADMGEGDEILIQSVGANAGELTVTLQGGTFHDGQSVGVASLVLAAGESVRLYRLTGSVYQVANRYPTAGEVDVCGINEYIHNMRDFRMVFSHENTGAFVITNKNGVPNTYENLVNTSDGGNGRLNFGAGSNGVYSKKANTVETVLEVDDYFEIIVGTIDAFRTIFVAFSDDENIVPHANNGEYRMRLASNGFALFDRANNQVAGNGVEDGTYRFTRTLYGWKLEKNGAFLYESPPVCIDYESAQNGASTPAHTVGDVKQGFQSADHDGWVLLNGRALSTLTAAQQAAAATVGLAGNLPDATNAYLSQNGAGLGSVSGSNAVTLTQANLPTAVFTGTTSSDGAHTHTYTRYATIPTNSSTGGNNGRWRGTQGVQTSSSGVHTHTVSVDSGGGDVPFSIAPQTLSVNQFVYLGP